MKPWRPEDLPKTLVITRMQEWSSGNRQIDQKCESHKRFSVRCFSINRKLRLLLMPIQNHLFGQPNSERSDIPKVNRNNTIISTCIRMGKLAAERYWKAFSTFSSPKKDNLKKIQKKRKITSPDYQQHKSHTNFEIYQEQEKWNILVQYCGRNPDQCHQNEQNALVRPLQQESELLTRHFCWQSQSSMPKNDHLERSYEPVQLSISLCNFCTSWGFFNNKIRKLKTLTGSGR